MRKPRRIWLLAGAFALVLGVIAWRSLSLPAQPSVTLTFLGYTNVMVPVGSAAYKVSLPVALVLATNLGPVGVKLIPILSPKNLVVTGRTFRPTHDVCTVRNIKSPQFLNPRESIVLEVMPRMDATSWQVEMAYHARSAPNEVLGRISKRSNPTVRRWLGIFYRSPEVFWAELGPLTNLPPAVMPEAKARKPQKGVVVMIPHSTNWGWRSTPARTNEVLPPPPSPDYSDGLRLY